MKIARKPPSPTGAFTIVPNSLWSQEGLNSEAKVIYAFLIGCKPDRDYEPKWIANRLNLSDGQWVRAWRQLKAQKLIEVRRVGSRAYELHIHEVRGVKTEGSTSGVSNLGGPLVTCQDRTPLNKTNSNKTPRTGSRGEVSVGRKKKLKRRSDVERTSPKRKLRPVPSVRSSDELSVVNLSSFLRQYPRGLKASEIATCFGTTPESANSCLRLGVIKSMIKKDGDLYRSA